jgi:uncharacterized protein (DUF433 family)
MMAMNSPELKAYKSYRWIVADPRMLGGAPAIRGTRYSVEHVLGAMAAGMTQAEIERAFGLPIPPEALSEAFALAAESVSNAHVAA